MGFGTSYGDDFQSCTYLCPGQESNLHLSLRSALFCPLNYRGAGEIISKRNECRLLDSIRLPLYNPRHSEGVRDRLSDRNEGHRLKTFTEKDRGSRLSVLAKKTCSLVIRTSRDCPLQQRLVSAGYRVRRKRRIEVVPRSERFVLIMDGAFLFNNLS